MPACSSFLKEGRCGWPQVVMVYPLLGITRTKAELSLKRKRKDDHCPEGPSLAQCSIIHKATQPKTASVQPLVVRRHAFARLVQDTLDNIHTPAEGWDEAKEMD